MPKLGVATYTIKSDDSLTFSEMSSKNIPSPRWEGMKGRGDGSTGSPQACPELVEGSTPTRTLPHRRGRDDWGNFKYFRLTLCLLFTLSLFTFHLSPSFGLPAEDVQLVTDAQYFQVAQKIIKEAKVSVHVIMFEMGYYDPHPNTPSNLLVKELINTKKKGVKVEVILEVREGEDRTTKRNRHTGKILSEGGVEVIFDPLSKTTHAKSVVVDGRLTLLGSTNWTYYALTNNHEVAVLVRSKELAKALIEYFNQVKSTGTKP
jgi:phosphatidylserine/phosphatidylglycerophosphate/cardiolipin synthase-like enzyme